MDPAILIIIRKGGVKTIRLIASSLKEEKAVMDLYLKIQGPVDKIQRILKSDGKERIS